MRYFFSIALVLALAACDTPTPNSERGVGFGSYDDYETDRAARETALRRGIAAPQAKISDEDAASTASEAMQTLANTTPLSATQQAAPSASANPRISDEQEFGAVSGRETIESDRERLANQKQQYKVIAPTAVPTRKGSGGPNVVEFALSSTNSVGQPIYRRSKVFASSRYRRNCAKYASPDLAQIAFLQSGGPSRDRKGLDPDGDGFACSWDPAPFRTARQ